MTYQSAFKKVIQELREDEGLYISWHANIAMAYVDVGGWEKSRDSTKKRHAIGNKAATHFLNLLMKPSVEKIKIVQNKQRKLSTTFKIGKPKKLRVFFGKEFVKDLIKLAKIENKKREREIE